MTDFELGTQKVVPLTDRWCSATGGGFTLLGLPPKFYGSA